MTTLRKLTTSSEDVRSLDKQRVKQTLFSLRDINRKILAANGIEEQVDDYIYLTIRMEQPIRPPARLGENVKNIQTPVQIYLPNVLRQESVLLLVKKGSKQKVSTLINDSGMDNIITVAEFDDVFDTLSMKR